MADKFIVVYDDEMGLCLPMSFDSACEGVLVGYEGSVALFTSKEDAENSIQISKRWNEILQLRGEIYNEDFTEESIRCIKIVPCQEMRKSKKRK